MYEYDKCMVQGSMISQMKVWGSKKIKTIIYSRFHFIFAPTDLHKNTKSLVKYEVENRSKVNHFCFEVEWGQKDIL